MRKTIAMPFRGLACVVVAMTLGFCGGCSKSDEDAFKSCPAKTRHLIETRVGPVEKFHFDKADYDPEIDPVSENDATIREGYANVGGKRLWFQCSVNINGNLDIDVRDAKTSSTVLNEIGVEP